MRLILIAVIASTIMLLGGCSEEQQNKLSRLGVTWMEGNYKVTFVEGSHVKVWNIIDSKVTSDPQKGYYYFWAINEAGKKFYVQTPIIRTYVEETR